MKLNHHRSRQSSRADNGGQRRKSNQRWKQGGESTRGLEEQGANRAERRKPSGAGTRLDAPPGHRRQMKITFEFREL
ncbi:hypothetical protein Bca52824_070034 [Brassica carinata]|uniref:Uncharacterized protein n=1 Tax=Brassica carinata TaxID=52824 RepID=A0A8X7Q3N4_BRACI|nr:hypothetical protein Bca52824_070034 [Brassica carinata]